MNKSRRGVLRQATNLLNQAISIIELARDAEQDCMDNMPDNLQGSDRYTNMENAIDNLEDAIEKIDEAKEYIGEAIA